MSLKSVTDRTTKHLSDLNPGAAFDPSMIILIAELISELVVLIQDCRDDPVEGAAIAKKPTWLQKRLLVRKTRKTLGRRAFREHGRDVMRSLMKTGRETNTNEMALLYEEVNMD